jgi:proteasome lid subunit RPN8/RPN11
MEFRYLIPEGIFNELTQECIEAAPNIVKGWLFADRYDGFALVKESLIQARDADCHIKPKSWMRIKKTKLQEMRRYKAEKNIDIAWQFHTHPDGSEVLHEIDLRILNYLSTGVFIIVTPTNIVGWFYDKRESKRALIEKMTFEVVNEE